jgi:hypothetical protein
MERALWDRRVAQRDVERLLNERVGTCTTEERETMRERKRWMTDRAEVMWR